MFTKVEVFGEVPLARFGHTITQGKFTAHQSDSIYYSIEIEGHSVRRSNRRHWKVYHYRRHVWT